PNTARIVEQLARSERRRLVMACPGFAVDCLETLYDIDLILRATYRDAQTDAANDLLYVPCLNATMAHAEVLARIIQQAV
ncbi:ferrochelatase, partial [Escherichia coli]|nr:ferrochelatase [Escherichia coli]